ncbi:hypothetical protein ROHU_008015 [Labeo rohita]|uniref:Uncharacterized protein n=1 Tax=Labeo rohita TaxID=84645 RepID=A0A498M9A6_LABRO|nr:hypothetical protein ROHU_008015 [Labeo rohita]
MRRCGRKSRGEKLNRSRKRVKFCCGENCGAAQACLKPAAATQHSRGARSCVGQLWCQARPVQSCLILQAELLVCSLICNAARSVQCL